VLLNCRYDAVERTDFSAFQYLAAGGGAAIDVTWSLASYGMSCAARYWLTIHHVALRGDFASVTPSYSVSPAYDKGKSLNSIMPYSLRAAYTVLEIAIYRADRRLHSHFSPTMSCFLRVYQQILQLRSRIPQRSFPSRSVFGSKSGRAIPSFRVRSSRTGNASIFISPRCRVTSLQQGSCGQADSNWIQRKTGKIE
jgi:hypothetical protein